MRTVEGISCPNGRSSIVQLSFMEKKKKQWEKRVSTVMKELNEDGEFQIVHVMFTWIVYPIAGEISQQVCAKK